jgi:hypothetical protein
MLHTNPPTSFEYGGTSVHPPPKSMRVGARVTMVVAMEWGLRGWEVAKRIPRTSVRQSRGFQQAGRGMAVAVLLSPYG